MQQVKDILTKQEIEDIRARGYADPVYFLRYMFPDIFTKPIPWFHRGLLAIATRRTDFLLQYGELEKILTHFVWVENAGSPNEISHPLFEAVYNESGAITALNLITTQHVSAIIPRGFSKTTLMGLGVAAWKIYYKEASFILYVSETSTHSEIQLGNLRSQIEENPRLAIIFGNIVPAREDSRKWTNDELHTSTDVYITCRGRGGQIRGLLKDNNRPDLVIVDDLEDEESVQTQEQRYKARRWFFNTLIRVLPRVGDESRARAQIIVIGTLLHNDALMMHLESSPKFTSIRLGAVDKDGDPLWAEAYTLDALAIEKDTYIRSGTLDGYYRELLSDNRTNETAKFNIATITTRIPHPAEVVATAIALDPAISPRRKADFASIGVVSMLSNGVINVRECWAKRGAKPREMLDMFFELEERYQCSKHGIESVAFQVALIHIMQEEMFRVQDNGTRVRRQFSITPITHGINKIVRVEGILQARYASGYIEHSKHFPELMSQLADWPNGKLDCPDAVSMAVALLDPYAAQVASPHHDLASDEYEPLHSIFGGDWRTYKESSNALGLQTKTSKRAAMLERYGRAATQSNLVVH